MTAKVILNPYAARWKAGERQAKVEAALQAAGVDYDLVQSEALNHAIQLVKDAVRAGFDPIIAAGGDGTIGEVVNGLAQAAGDDSLATLGVMPLGTANDLAVNVGLPTDLDEAARVIAAGKVRAMDLCKVNDRYFVNNAGVGLEPYVSIIQQRMTKIHGIIRYLLSALTGIAHNPKWTMSLKWDDGEFQGPVTLVSISNSPLTGGVFYTVPHADPFDGKLTFIYGFLPTRIKILGALIMLLKPAKGNITEHPAVHEVHTTRLKVHVEPSTPAHSDGEVFSEAIQDLEYSILPGRLPILLGNG